MSLKQVMLCGVLLWLGCGGTERQWRAAWWTHVRSADRAHGPGQRLAGRHDVSHELRVQHLAQARPARPPPTLCARARHEMLRGPARRVAVYGIRIPAIRPACACPGRSRHAPRAAEPPAFRAATRPARPGRRAHDHASQCGHGARWLPRPGRARALRVLSPGHLEPAHRHAARPGGAAVVLGGERADGDGDAAPRHEPVHPGERPARTKRLRMQPVQRRAGQTWTATRRAGPSSRATASRRSTPATHPLSWADLRSQVSSEPSCEGRPSPSPGAGKAAADT